MDTYQPTLNFKETEIAIKQIKDLFENKLANNLNLIRVSAPLFVAKDSGFNDDLNGVETPVSFLVQQEEMSIVHSLAKWKRYALKKYGFSTNFGLYTDMNAIRKDEKMDALHSIYVDQWDWEKVIDKKERNLSYLQKNVEIIYQVMKEVQTQITNLYPNLIAYLPEKIHFITTTEAEKKYPHLDSKMREYELCKKYGSVFLMQIGDTLPLSQLPHDLRAPDYDDWQLNGDILVYYPPLDTVLELSSMGIRVDEKSLMEQLKKASQTQRCSLFYHQMLLNQQLPFTIGGGIGQSRFCMLLLNKLHIGEVQSSYWSEEILLECQKKNIPLL